MYLNVHKHHMQEFCSIPLSEYVGTHLQRTRMEYLEAESSCLTLETVIDKIILPHCLFSSCSGVFTMILLSRSV